MASGESTQDAASRQDAEAAIVCGGVALAACRRVLRSYRREVWLVQIAQAAVGISTMVMSVVLLCFMVHRVAEGHQDFAESRGQLTASFTIITVRLFLQPILSALLLLVPCRSRSRLYWSSWCIASMSFQLDINAFIQIMVWRLNDHTTCQYLDEGAADMSCSSVLATGTATAVLVLLAQGVLDWWNYHLVHKARPFSADPVMREVLSSEYPWARVHMRVVRWLLADGEPVRSFCESAERRPPEANYDHKRTDIELSDRRGEVEGGRYGSVATLPPYQPREFGTVHESAVG